MGVPIEHLKTILGHLLAETDKQLTAIDQASTSNLAHVRTLGANLWQAIDRLERWTVLVIASTTACVWDWIWQRTFVDQLDALYCRAKRLLAGVFPDDEPKALRFATRLSALDPLALFRKGPGWIADVAGKLIHGPEFRDPHDYHRRDVIADVSLREADLSLANLAATRLSYVDAWGANLEGAIATNARLLRVNLARASLRDAELDAAVASNCNFRNTDLVNAQWNDGTALQCSFDGAELMDMSADRTTFKYCSFQSADLTASLDSNVTMAGALFEKCDLRWSRWHNRSLKEVRFIGCKLYGVKGANFDGASIVLPDMSPAGDGSRGGSLTNLLVSKALHEEAS